MIFRRASELAEDPELMRPRAVMVPPCVVAGMITLVAMLAKGGKSTTLAGVIRDASLQGIACALLSLDEALTDSVQRLERLGADLDLVFVATEWEPGELEAELIALGVKVLGIDHLGKLAERDPDFGANSQGDPLLWGRLISPIADLARRNDIGVVLLDQARRSDGGYTGSNAKAATVDILAELREKDGGLVCTPKSRIPLPWFRVDLDANGAPVFSTATAGDAPAVGQGVVSTKVVATCFRALQDAGEEGLTSNAWSKICGELGIPKSTWNRARGALKSAHQISYASRIYRSSPSGDRAFGASDSLEPNSETGTQVHAPPAQVGASRIERCNPALPMDVCPLVPVVPVGASGTSGTFPQNGSTQFPTRKGGTSGSIGLPELGDAWEAGGNAPVSRRDLRGFTLRGVFGGVAAQALTTPVLALCRHSAVPDHD